MRSVVFGDNDQYRISENGELFSRMRARKLTDTWVSKKPSFRKSDYTGAGYLVTGLCITPGKVKHHYLHRLVAEYFCDKPANCSEVDHIDGNRLNNNASNLRWVNHLENMKNAIQRGAMKEHRSCKGRLKECDVIEMARMINLGINRNEIAEKFSIDPTMVSAFKNNGKVFKKFQHLVNKKPTAKKTDKTEIIRLYLSGFKQVKIAKMLNASEDVVYKAVSAHKKGLQGKNL